MASATARQLSNRLELRPDFRVPLRVILHRSPFGVFPNINIPVVSVVWTYTGAAGRAVMMMKGSSQDRFTES
jgi:hypothetical protein